ncbi:unnamed protein product [Blepharisma stoltei]|uniref:Uncharacterized protein n=1 Tax=Blepharisma stoltei TaxID=1481888 RepID=A0AAU9IU31_9CILI|nr:unnamed protein product [Blepharisma stoltei]
MYRSPKDLNYNFEDSDSDAIARIDDTLARSRKVVQDSIELTKKSAERKAELEKKLQKSFESFQEEEDSQQTSFSSKLDKKPPIYSSLRSSSPHYEILPLQEALTPSIGNSKILDSRFLQSDQIKDLQERLQNEEQMKKNYEKALRETRVCLQEYEKRDLDKENQIQELKNLINQTLEKDEFKEFTNDFEFGTNKENELNHVRKLSTDNELAKLKNENEALKKEIVELKNEFEEEKGKLQAEIEMMRREKKSLEVDYHNLYNVHSHSSNGSLDVNIMQELQFAKDKLQELQNEYSRNYSEIKQKLDKQVAENIKLTMKSSPDYIDKLENKYQVLEEKYQDQVAYNKELQKQFNRIDDDNRVAFKQPDIKDFEIQMKKNADKIKELEEKINTTSSRYKKLKTHVAKKYSLESLSKDTPRQTPALTKEGKAKKVKSKKSHKTRSKSVEKNRKSSVKLMQIKSDTPRRKFTPLR